MSRLDSIGDWATSTLTARRWLQWINVVAYLGGVLVIVVSLNVLAQRPQIRMQVDATKTRAYSLSEQTQLLLGSLDGEWTIAIVSAATDTDRAIGRQVDEVLRRFDEASPNLGVARIDPTDPASLGAFERLLGDLRWTYADRVRQYESAFDAGDGALRDLLAFAREEAGGLRALATTLPEQFEGTADLQRRAQLLGLLADEGDAVVEEVVAAHTADRGRPLPDYVTAQSILVAAIGRGAQELADTAEILRRLAAEVSTDPRLQQQILDAATRYDQRSQRLAVTVDPLMQLPPLELATIGRRLQEGQAAIVMGPRGAAVIPGEQLLPRTNLKVQASSVSFDQRFRGEQLIAATIRSLLVDQMPMVVFTHAEERSLFRPEGRDVDLVGVREQLKASRYDVHEWIVHQGQRPVPDADQPVVWVVVAPPKRSGLAIEAPEQELLEQAATLIDEGEPVLLSLYPSLAKRYGRRDPWIGLAHRVGLDLDTSTVIHESVLVSEEQTDIERGQAVQRYPGDHPIVRAIQGQQAYFSLPMPLEVIERNGSTARHEPLVEVEPDPQRWLAQDWMQPASQVQPPPADERLAQTVAVAIATERTSPTGRGRQRVITVGSGGWMLSYVADVAVGVGGDRFALVNPGNHELMLSSVAWLGGMDDLIAAGPSGQQVSRLGGIGPGARRSWFWITVALMPGLCVVMSTAMWIVRRV